MSAAGTQTRRKTENVLRNLESKADELRREIASTSNAKEKTKQEKKLATVLKYIAEKESAIAKKAEEAATKAVAKAAANAEKEAAKAKREANKAAGITQTRKKRTKNEIAANLAKKAEEAARKAEEARIREAGKAAEKAARELAAATKKSEREAKKAVANEARAFSGLPSLFGNRNNINATATRRNNPFTKFVTHISKGYKNKGKTLKKGTTYVSAAAAFRRANPSRYANFVTNSNAFNMSNVEAFINTYDPSVNEYKVNKTSKKSLQKKLQAVQKKCSESIESLEQQIAALNATGIEAAAAEAELSAAANM